MNTYNQLAVYDVKHNAIPLTSLWQDQPTLLFFQRSPGCSICRQKLFELKANAQTFTDHNINLVAISLVTPILLQGLIQQYQLPFPMYSDINGSIYKAFGFRQTPENLADDPEVRRHAQLAHEKGQLPSDTLGTSLAQLGGIVLFDQAAPEPMFIHVADPVYFYPDWEEILAKFTDHSTIQY